MIYVKNESNNPYFNLALEEYVLNYMDNDDEYLLLWRNEPSVIVGKHQNTIEEINMDFIKKNNVNVVRRISGGGAVYHDLGNLNFSFIVKNRDSSTFDFKKYTEPIINVLKKLNIKAAFNSRNDLTIKGKKFSGNSQYMKNDRLLHHGTLLFNSNLDNLTRVLSVSEDKIASKGVKSVRSRVTNIIEHLSKPIDILEFRNLILEYFNEEKGKIKEYNLTRDDVENINRLMKNKYMTWEWNYGESPEFNIRKSKRLKNGKVEVFIKADRGIIKNCKFYGDFFGSGELYDVESRLIGKRYEEQDIKDSLRGINLDYYFANISIDEIVSCII